MAELDLIVRNGYALTTVTITDIRGALSSQVVEAIEQQDGIEVTDRNAGVTALGDKYESWEAEG